MWVQSLGWEDALEKETATTPVFLSGKSHGRRSLVGYSRRVTKSPTRLSDYTSFPFFLSFNAVLSKTKQNKTKF